MNINRICSYLLTAFACSLFALSAQAQTGGGPGGVPAPPPTPAPAPAPVVNGGDNTNTFDTGNLVNGGTGDAQIEDFTINSITPEIVNERNVPFVGPASEGIQHPLSQNAAGAGGAGGGGGGLGGLNIGNRGGGAGFGSAGPGFTVVRRSLRSRLTNAVVVPTNQVTRDSNTTSRFNQRMVRIPSISRVTGVQVSVQNRRATLVGSVATQQERQMVERMARLEPGIYSIDNQITVRNQQQ